MNFIYPLYGSVHRFMAFGSQGAAPRSEGSPHMASKTRPTTKTAAEAPVAPATVDVTDETLLATRGRALALLAAAGGVEGIRRALAARGYTEVTHREGWTALHGASGYNPGSAGFVAVEPDEVTEARRAVDIWDDVNFPIAEASLKHRHPEAHAKVFGDGLSPGNGAESVVRVEEFLNRLDTLTKTDPAALRTLATRGITPDERTRVRALVKSATAFRPVDPQADAASATSRAKVISERDDALRVLRAWYEEWSTIAKQVIVRKDWLILMGLAARKKPAKKPVTT